jgi:hypothetical protein
MKPNLSMSSVYHFCESRTSNIKSDNIVVDFDQHGTFSRIKLIDLGDSVRIDGIKKKF